MVDICRRNCGMDNFCMRNYVCNVLASDNDIFQTLYENYRQQIFRYFCDKIKNNQSIAEDLTQEVFTKAYQNLNKIRCYCNIRNWLYTIANNTLMDYWRKNFRSPLNNLASDLDSLSICSNEGIPLNNLLQNELMLKLKSFYKSLPQDHFRAIFLHEYENYNYAQAAKIMNLSLTNYTSLLNRARLKLQKIAIADLLGIDINTLSKNEYKAISKWFAHIRLTDYIAESINQGMLSYFNGQANLYNDLSYHNYHSLIDDYLLDKYPLKKQDIAADFGMGTGIFTSNLSFHVQRVDGYDFSQEMCILAKDNFNRNNIHNVNCYILDFTELGEKFPKYDYVYCMTVLHHLAYPGKAVESIARSLRKGGGLIISDFYKHKCSEMVEKGSDLWYGFTKEQFITFLSYVGLKNIWVEIHKDFPIVFRTREGRVVKIPTIIGGGEK